MKKPKVSILIPNRNHASYLEKSIESALNQTYPNIEVIFSDNCSNDESIRVAMKYCRQGLKVNKNPNNITAWNYCVCYDGSSSESEYFMLLPADDYIEPECIEKMVSLMEEYPDVAFIHVERDYIDEDGSVLLLSPFFNCNFKIDGKKMLPIFMLTDVGQSAQALIRKSAFEKVGRHNTENRHLNIDREQWFRLSMYGEYIYLQDKLTKIRRHGDSETSAGVKNFNHPIRLYQTIRGFIEWANLRDYKDVLHREQLAYHKLAQEMMVYVKDLIGKEDFELANQYLLFVELIDVYYREISDYPLLKEMCRSRKSDIDFKETILSSADRKREYNPPSGYQQLGGA